MHNFAVSPRAILSLLSAGRTLHLSRTVAARVIAAAGVAGVLALAGCAVYVPGEQAVATTSSQQVYLPAGGTYQSSEVYVPSAPPAPMQEVVAVRPSINMVWIPGVWFWGGSRYVWRAGHWAHPPSGYRHYSPGNWQNTPRGYRWAPGNWHR